MTQSVRQKQSAISKKNAKKQDMKALGKKGGNATKKKYGAEHFRKLGLEGASKRWELDTEDKS